VWKFSPRIAFNDIEETDADAMYPYILEQLNNRKLAYVHVSDSTGEGWHAKLRPVYQGAYFAGAGFTKDSGEALLAEGHADAIVYGTKILANPDLPERFRRSAPLNQPDSATFYAPGEQGYIDYPTLEETAAAAK
jgi:N-ethylmaleimide reductase